MASRKAQKEARRKGRLEREQAAQRAAARKRLGGILVGAVLAVGLASAIAVALVAGGGDGGGDPGEARIDFPDAREIPDQVDADLKTSLEGSGCKLESVPLATEADHREGDIKYETNPPASGPQDPVPAEDDLYEESPSEERVLHALEHGRVAIWVNPVAPGDVLAGVRALYEKDRYHVIVTPQTGLKEQVAMSAWEADAKGRILRCRRLTDDSWDALRAFKTQYRDKGPEFAP